MQLTLRGTTETGEDIIKEHGIDWTLIKVSPSVTLFKGPGAWLESVKDKFGMWISITMDLESVEDKFTFEIKDPDYKHLL